MIPTDEQIFDYFLGKTPPDVSRHISAYLASNPSKARELKEWADLEIAFEEFPLKTPSELVLNRVRDRAREVGRPQANTWLTRIKAAFTFREMALSFGLVAAVALLVVIRADLQTNSQNLAMTDSNNGSQLLAMNADNSTVNLSNSATNKAAETTLLDYKKSLELFQSGDFTKASDGFSQIMVQSPNFEKRKELYTYWVETLKKLGQFELAEKKQLILEQIAVEEAATK
jgi:anti-sigma factor RsiW